jgi:hypothetical protein
MTEKDNATDIFFRLLVEEAEDALARHDAWRDANKRHPLKLSPGNATTSRK